MKGAISTSFTRAACLVLLPVLAGVYFLWDPARNSWFPGCVFHHFTGWYCAGCGGQRALHALLHARPLQAAGYNLLLVLALLATLTIAFDAYLGTGNLKKALVRHGHKIAPLCLLLVLFFALLRNLPLSALAWLAP